VDEDGETSAMLFGQYHLWSWSTYSMWSKQHVKLLNINKDKMLTHIIQHAPTSETF